MDVTPGRRELVDQIRGLFRHAPFSEQEFVRLAPNLAQTLSPREPFKALGVFWDILDQQERDRNLDALIALLGFGPHRGSVNDRKVSVNEDVHPRTVARWADRAVETLVAYIEDRYSLATANVEIYYTQPPLANKRSLSVTFKWLGEMDMPALRINGDIVPLKSEMIVSAGIGKVSVLDAYDEEPGHLTDLDVEWTGSIQPTFRLWGNHPDVLDFNSGSSWGYIQWLSPPLDID